MKTHNFAKHERGVAAIEFALLLPILVMLLFGMIEFSRGYNAKITATHAAREGVRAHVLGDDGQAAAAASSPRVSTSDVSAPVGCTVGQPATLTVSIDVTYTIPFFASGTFTIDESATMRCEVNS